MSLEKNTFWSIVGVNIKGAKNINSYYTLKSQISANLANQAGSYCPCHLSPQKKPMQESKNIFFPSRPGFSYQSSPRYIFSRDML